MSRFIRLGKDVRDELMKRLDKAGVGRSLIAEVLGISRQRVSQKLGPTLGRVADERAAGVRYLARLRAGESVSRVALDEGVATATVRRRVVAVAGMAEYDRVVAARLAASQSRREAKARAMVQEFARRYPGYAITYNNLVRALGQAQATYVDRVKSYGEWRAEFGQPEVLAGVGKTREHGQHGLMRVVED